DDPQRERAHVDWTAHDATAALWVSVFRTGPGAGAELLGLDTAEVRVRCADGRVDVHPLPAEVTHG
uniref:hypothetical protein n=1 Tax=Promicromonospora kroppenstedtii TaxID=440482 RepID=UPI0005645DF1